MILYKKLPIRSVHLENQNNPLIGQPRAGVRNLDEPLKLLDFGVFQLSSPKSRWQDDGLHMVRNHTPSAGKGTARTCPGKCTAVFGQPLVFWGHPRLARDLANRSSQAGTRSCKPEEKSPDRCDYDGDHLELLFCLLRKWLDPASAGSKRLRWRFAAHVPLGSVVRGKGQWADDSWQGCVIQQELTWRSVRISKMMRSLEFAKQFQRGLRMRHIMSHDKT